MRRYLALFMLMPACGPTKDPGLEPADASSAGEASSSSAGDSTGSAGPSGSGIDPTAPTTGTTDASTSGEPGSMTAAPTVTGATGDDEPPQTTGGPDPGALRVLVLHGEPGPHPGVEGVALWQSGMPEACEEPPPASCKEVPTVGEPQLLVDGELQGADAVKFGSRVAVLFPFAHAACELGCGGWTMTFLIGAGGDGGKMFGEFPIDIPCSTEESDVWLAVDFNEVSLLEPYSAELAITDRCGASSPAQKLEFTPT